MDIKNQDWNAFLKTIKGVHLLQTKGWGDLKSCFGWQVGNVRNQKSGAQILFKPLPLGFSWAYLPKGPIGSDSESLWPLIHRECRRRRAVFLKVEPDGWSDDRDRVPINMEVAGFRFSQHQIQPRRTIVVDLTQTEDEILSRMKQKTRYNIRLASRKGVVVKIGKEIPDSVKKFHQLMEITGERDNFGVHSLEYYQKAYEMFSPGGECELFFGYKDEDLLAGIMVFMSGNRSWYFYGASSNQYRNLMAPYAVQWEAMKWARSNGSISYDLWGVPDYELDKLEAEFMERKDGLWGVYRFKRGFGGELRRSNGAWDRVYHPILYSFYLLWMKKSQS